MRFIASVGKDLLVMELFVFITVMHPLAVVYLINSRSGNAKDSSSHKILILAVVG